MPRCIRILIGTLALAVWIVLTLPPAAAQQPIQTQTLLEQRLELPSQRPICWDVRQGSLAPGRASPSSGFHVHGWVVAHVFDGVERFEYEDGRSGTVGPGQATLFEQGVPHRHENIGADPRTNIGFELTCERLSGSIANTGPLPGIRPGVSYQLQVRERVWQPGAQTPVHILSGPTATYVIEGTIARVTSAGVAHSGTGELYVSPVGELAQNTNVGGIAARTLDVDLWPTGETRSVPRPQAQLPDPTRAAPAQAPGQAGAAPAQLPD